MAKERTLDMAFSAGLDAVRRSAKVKTSKNLADKFTLLPKNVKSEYHRVKVLFEDALPPKPAMEIGDLDDHNHHFRHIPLCELPALRQK